MKVGRAVMGGGFLLVVLSVAADYQELAGDWVTLSLYCLGFVIVGIGIVLDLR